MEALLGATFWGTAAAGNFGTVPAGRTSADFCWGTAGSLAGGGEGDDTGASNRV